jgi:hypothetical protein
VYLYFTLKNNLQGLLHLEDDSAFFNVQEKIIARSNEMFWLKIFCQVVTVLFLTIYFFVLWLVSSTGQPPSAQVKNELIYENARNDSIEDILDLLELET